VVHDVPPTFCYEPSSMVFFKLLEQLKLLMPYILFQALLLEAPVNFHGYIIVNNYPCASVIWLYFSNVLIKTILMTVFLHLQRHIMATPMNSSDKHQEEIAWMWGNCKFGGRLFKLSLNVKIMMQSRFGLAVKVPFSAPWLNNPMSDVWLFTIPKKQK
jgi:hypothetical protein